MSRGPNRRVRSAPRVPLFLQRLPYTLMGIALLPALWGLGDAFYRLLVKAQLRPEGGRLLLHFLLGAGCWGLVFAFLSRPMRSYVLAHELSHALAALLSGARVGRMRVGAEGGSVEVSHSSIWIALAPYMIPFYSLLLLIAVGIAQLFWDPGPWLAFLPFGLGLTWAFHLSFTLYALSIGQSDIHPYGALGAYPLILVVNLLVLVLGLALAGPAPFEAMGTLLAALADAYLQAFRILRP